MAGKSLRWLGQLNKGDEFPLGEDTKLLLGRGALRIPMEDPRRDRVNDEPPLTSEEREDNRRHLIIRHHLISRR